MGKFIHQKNFRVAKLRFLDLLTSSTGRNWPVPPKTPQEGPSGPKTAPTSTIHDYMWCWPTLEPLWADPKISILRPWKFVSNGFAHLFLTLLLTQKGTFCAILTNLKMVFLRKILFFAYPIWAKNGLFWSRGPRFDPKTRKHCIPGP